MRGVLISRQFLASIKEKVQHSGKYICLLSLRKMQDE